MSYRNQELDQRMNDIARQRQYQKSQPQYQEEQRYNPYDDDYSQEEYQQMEGGRFNYSKLAKGIGKSRVLSTGLMLSGNPTAGLVARQLGAGFMGMKMHKDSALRGLGLVGGQYNQQYNDNMYGGYIVNPDTGKKIKNYKQKEHERRPLKKSVKGWPLYVSENYHAARDEAIEALSASKKRYEPRDVQTLTMQILGVLWRESPENKGPKKSKSNFQIYNDEY